MEQCNSQWREWTSLTPEPPEKDKYGFIPARGRQVWGIKVSRNCNGDRNGWHNYTAKLVRLWKNLNP